MFIVKGGMQIFQIYLNSIQLFYILVATLYSYMKTIHNIIYYIIYNKI